MLALAKKLSLPTIPTYRFVNKHSIVFDGVDDCIITDGADTVAQNTTYSFWCKSSQTGANFGVFGHGNNETGAFHFNESSEKPLLWLNSAFFRYWNDTPAQDDGEWHHWVVYSDTNDITNSKLYVDSVLQTPSTTSNIGGAAAYTESLTIAADRASGGNHFEGNIDEFAVFDRELTQAEITRMYNTFYSPNRVANGNFAQIGNEKVTNGDFSEVGADLVVNGDFATDSVWGKGSGWTISGGTANSDGTSGSNNLYQDNILVVGKQYKIDITVSNYVSGNVEVSAGAVPRDTMTANGTYTFYQTCTPNTTFYIVANSFNGSIDNVSVKEVGQDWTKETGWTIANSKAVANTTGTQQIYQNVGLVNGKSYKISYSVSDFVSGAMYLSLNGNGFISPPSTSDDNNVVHYLTYSGSDATIYFRGSPNVNASIDNVSVKEVGQGWTLGAGWTIAGGIASQSGGVGQLYQTISTTVGVDCKITFTANVTAGAIRIAAGPGAAIADFTSGTHTLIVPFLGNTTLYILGSSASFVGSIDNVVVQELKHDATNLMLNAGAYQSANPLITSTNSMDFDGVDDYLDIGSDCPTGNFSVSSWVKKTGGGGWYAIFSASTQIWFGLNDNGRILAHVGGPTLSTTGVVDINKWHYLTLTWDGTTSIIYVDGVQVVTSTGTNNPAATEYDIGRTSSSNNNYFDGLITEVGLYDRALTSLEVASLYNQGMPTNLLVNRNDYQSGNPTVFNTKQVDFDGSDDYMIANSTLGNFTGSVSCWVKRDSYGTDMYLYDARGLGNTGAGYVYLNSATPSIASESGGTIYVNGVLGTNITTNEWHHVVVTGQPLNINTDIIFGSRFSLGAILNGQLSQVGIWNSTLTADEVSSLYNHGLPVDLNTDQAAYTSSSNLVGYWRMGSGTLDSYPVIYDQTNATLGSELVVNGTFETPVNTNQWFNFSSPTTAERSTNYAYEGTHSYHIVGDSTNDGTQASASQFVGDYTVGDVVKITAYVYPITASSNQIKTGVNGTNRGITSAYFNLVLNEWNKVEYYVTISTASNNYITFLIAGSAGEFYLDNVSAQIVGGNPAIMTNMTASDIENGSPYANIVQNSDFATDSDWNNNVGNDWQIVNGKLILTTTSSNNINQGGLGLVQNKFYKIVFTITNTTLGGVRIRLGTGSFSSTYTDGTHTLYLQQTTTNDAFRFYSDSSGVFNGEIDNVTVTEVNTGLQGYWKMGSGINDEYPVIYDQTNPTLSAELVTNGDFSNGTTDWSSVNSAISVSNNQLTVDDTASAGVDSRAVQNIATENGKKYILRFNRISTTSVFWVAVGNGSSYSDILRINLGSNIGAYARVFTALGTTSTIALITGGTGISVFSNVTVKEMSGNFAEMTNMVEGNITNQYPLTKIRNYYRMGDGILDKFPCIQDQTSPNLAHIPTTNVLTYSEDFANSAWTKVGQGTGIAPVVTSNNSVSPDGTLNASKIVFDTGIGTSSGDISIVEDSVSLSSGIKLTQSVYLKGSVGGETILMRGAGGGVYQTLTLTNDWVRYEFTETSIATTSYFSFGLRQGLGGVIINQTITVYVWGAQFEEQTQATAYLKSDGIASVRKATTTNLITYSEDFNNAIWSKLAAGTGIAPIVTSDYSLSPINTQTADRIQFNLNGGTSGGDISYINTAFSLGTINASVSIYLKTNDNTTKDITLRLGAGLLDYDVTVTSEWQRFSLSGNTNVDRVQLLLYGSDNSQTADLSVWGVQLEQQTQAETYAPTFGLPVTIDLFTENNYGTMINMTAGDIVPDTPNN